MDCIILPRGEITEARMAQSFAERTSYLGSPLLSPAGKISNPCLPLLPVYSKGLPWPLEGLCKPPGLTMHLVLLNLCLRSQDPKGAALAFLEALGSRGEYISSGRLLPTGSLISQLRSRCEPWSLPRLPHRQSSNDNSIDFIGLLAF